MNVDEVIKKYVSEQRGTYRLLSEKTKEFLSSILSSKGIVPHSITSREKDPEKLREKITGEGEVPDALFDKMKCEIQVRTILQHAWAEIEHDIVYKSPGEIPFRVRRRFACLAGLLEIADREFESLRQDEMAVRQAIQSRIKKVKFDT